MFKKIILSVIFVSLLMSSCAVQKVTMRPSLDEILKIDVDSLFIVEPDTTVVEAESLTINQKSINNGISVNKTFKKNSISKITSDGKMLFYNESIRIEFGEISIEKMIRDLAEEKIKPLPRDSN
jgi:hypothetical protein